MSTIAFFTPSSPRAKDRVAIWGCLAMVAALGGASDGWAQYRYYQGVAPGFRPQQSVLWDVGGPVGMHQPQSSLAFGPRVAADPAIFSAPTVAPGSPVAWAPTAAGPTIGTHRDTGGYYRPYRAATKPFTQVQRPDAFATYRFLLESDSVGNGWYNDVNPRWFDEFGYD